MKPVVLAIAALGCAFTAQSALALGDCIPGRKESVIACDNLSTTANYNRTTTRDCVYNPPAGWVIVDHKVNVISSNNGSRSVSVLAGGSKFASEFDIKYAFDSLDEILGEYTDSDGNNKYKGKLEERRRGMLREIRRYSASHNTLHATVSASGHGNTFDRKRGWETINVVARLRCLGLPDREKLAEQVAKEVGLERGSRVRVENGCPQAIRVAIRYRRLNGQWETEGWWNISGNKHTGLSSSESKPIRTNSRVIYYYADIPGLRYAWSGANDNENDILATVGGEQFKFRHARPGRKRGAYTIALNCPNLD